MAAQFDPRAGEIPTPAGIESVDRPASLSARAGAAVFSHDLPINAVVSLLCGSDRVLAFRPDHASITILETDGTMLNLVAEGRDAATGVL